MDDTSGRVRRRIGTVGYAELPVFSPARYVRVGDRMLPPWVDVVMPGAGGQPRLALRLEVIDGVPQCRELTLSSSEGGREIRQLDLRAVHVDELVAEIYGMLAMRVVSEGDGVITVAEHGDDAGQADAVRTIREARKGRHARKITPEFLAEVARVYRENIDGNPTQAVERAFDVSKRMASLYVSRAREAGLLPPTTRGRKRA